MKRVSLISTYYSSSLRGCLVQTKPLVAIGNPLGYHLIKKYSKHQGDHNVHVLDKERAPSTAEIMDEITQEKEDNARILDEKSQQGFVSQTSDKLLDAAKEAVASDTKPEQVKQIFKDGSPGETYHKPRDDGGVGPTSV